MRFNDPNALVAEIVTMLHSIIYAPEGSITANTNLSDLGLDSLDLVEAGLELEAAIGCELPDGALFNIQTIGDLAACLTERSVPEFARAA